MCILLESFSSCKKIKYSVLSTGTEHQITVLCGNTLCKLIWSVKATQLTAVAYSFQINKLHPYFGPVKIVTVTQKNFKPKDVTHHLDL